jgi:hypothetical protein
MRENGTTLRQPAMEKLKIRGTLAHYHLYLSVLLWKELFLLLVFSPLIYFSIPTSFVRYSKLYLSSGAESRHCNARRALATLFYLAVSGHRHARAGKSSLVAGEKHVRGVFDLVAYEERS